MRFSIIRKAYGAGNKRMSITMDTPARLPKAGDKIRVLHSFVTPVEVYREGDILEVISRTRSNPWNTWCTLGNLKIKGKDGNITVWSNIEWAIVERTMEIV
jgi:hypothetical protein